MKIGLRNMENRVTELDKAIKLLHKEFDERVKLINNDSYNLGICDGLLLAKRILWNMKKVSDMQNVIVPQEMWYEEDANSHFGFCSCGKLLMEIGGGGEPFDIFCRKCGKRVLWKQGGEGK